MSMKAADGVGAPRGGAARCSRGRLLLLATLLAPPAAPAAVLGVELYSSGDFAVLAGAGITVTGPTTISGDIGSHPTLSITGLENVTLDGVNHDGDAATQQARLDLAAAYGDAAGRSATTLYDDVFDLGGLTLASGVYRDNSSFGLTGTLTLDAGGNPNAVWVFQAGSTLITAAGSHINLTGGAQAANIFWQVGSSATLGAGTDFAGSILAMASITLNAGATVDGRLLARNGAVTLDSNEITAPRAGAVPEPGTLGLLGVGLLLLHGARKQHRPPA
jgi:hypothetical protein